MEKTLQMISEALLQLTNSQIPTQFWILTPLGWDSIHKTNNNWYIQTWPGPQKRVISTTSSVSESLQTPCGKDPHPFFPCTISQTSSCRSLAPSQTLSQRDGLSTSPAEIMAKVVFTSSTLRSSCNRPPNLGNVSKTVTVGAAPPAKVPAPLPGQTGWQQHLPVSRGQGRRANILSPMKQQSPECDKHQTCAVMWWHCPQSAILSPRPRRWRLPRESGGGLVRAVEEVEAFLLAGSVGDSLGGGEGSGEHLQLHVHTDNGWLTLRYFTWISVIKPLKCLSP